MNFFFKENKSMNYRFLTFSLLHILLGHIDRTHNCVCIYVELDIMRWLFYILSFIKYHVFILKKNKNK